MCLDCEPTLAESLFIIAHLLLHRNICPLNPIKLNSYFFRLLLDDFLVLLLLFSLPI
jgi:hypothetical protein